MSNESLLFINLIVTYSLVLLWFYLFKKQGLYVWLIIAALVANIEVMVQIDAYGFHQTLGNILFASTFLATDILSEFYGKKEANFGVNLSIVACVSFMILSQFWQYFTPNVADFALPHLRVISAYTLRVISAGLIVFVAVQKLDIFLYHKIWQVTGTDNHKFLWLRNNIATIVSQAINTVSFNFGAFYGVFPTDTLWEIIFINFIIFVATSLLDTPFVYLAARVRVMRNS